MVVSVPLTVMSFPVVPAFCWMTRLPLAVPAVAEAVEMSVIVIAPVLPFRVPTVVVVPSPYRVFAPPLIVTPAGATMLEPAFMLKVAAPTSRFAVVSTGGTAAG